MRVAVIKSNGYIDTKLERLLGLNKIKGDFISKFTRKSLNKYDTVIFTYKNNIPNLPKVLESIVLEKEVFVIYVNNTLSTGEFYNFMSDLYFSIVNEQNIEVELLSILNTSLKYIKEINGLKAQNILLKDELGTMKLVNKAKTILISKGLSEADSHKFIQRKAMSLRLSKKQTANLIIENKIDI